MASSWLMMMSVVALNCLPARAGVVPRTQTQGNVYLSYLDTKGRTSERMVTRPDIYLIQFGYAASWNDSVVGDRIKSGRSVELEGKELEDALKQFQRKHKLNETGQPDSATLNFMRRPRCGMKDVKGRFALAPTKWTKKNFTYNFQSYSKKASKELVTLALDRAFKYWENVTPLRFERRPDSEKVDLRIGFSTGFHGDGVYNSFDGPEGVLAHAFYPDDGNIHFDDAEHFTEGTEEGKNLRIVAAHEIGHALGLDHSWFEGALMYPSYQGFISHDTFKLSEDDVGGIQNMYGQPTAVKSSKKTKRQSPANLLASNDSVPVPTVPVTPSSVTTPAPTAARTTRPPPPLTTTTPVVTTTRRPVVPITRPIWPKPTAGPGQPEPCTAKIDAAFLWHDAGKYTLRGSLLYRQAYGIRSSLSFNFPRHVRRYLQEAPEKVDAAVYSPYSTNLYLFKNKTMYTYDRVGYLRSVIEITAKYFPYRMDAAFVNREGSVCFIKGTTLYEFDEWRKTIAKRMAVNSVYKGLPEGIDAAINDYHWVPEYQFIYFFKGQKYYKVDVKTRNVVRGYPKDFGAAWFGCARYNVPK